MHIGERLLALAPEQAVDVAAGEVPAEAFVLACCEGCGTRQVIAAAVVYTCYDDDHFGRIEAWYESRHRVTCSVCRGGIDVALSYTLTNYPATGRREIALDPLVHPARPRTGAMLVPIDDATAHMIAERCTAGASNRVVAAPTDDVPAPPSTPAKWTRP